MPLLPSDYDTEIKGVNYALAIIERKDDAVHIKLRECMENDAEQAHLCGLARKVQRQVVGMSVSKRHLFADREACALDCGFQVHLDPRDISNNLVRTWQSS